MGKKPVAWSFVFIVIAAVGQLAFAQTSGADHDPAASLANKLAWQLRIAKAKPTVDDILYVLMHSSKDCPYCIRWRKDPAGLANAKAIVDAYPKVRIFVVDRDSLDAAERSSQYPRELAFEYERRLAANDLAPGVPLFEIFLRGEVVYRASGLDTWVDRVIPAVVAIEKRREGSALVPGGN